MELVHGCFESGIQGRGRRAVGDLVQSVSVENFGKVRVGYDAEWEEYRVQCWDVTGYLWAEYHSGDRDDALGTAGMIGETMREDMPSPEHLQALVQYACRNGLRWKDRLSAAWSNGSDVKEIDGPLLRQIRNRFGPHWLAGLEWRHLPSPSPDRM